MCCAYACKLKAKHVFDIITPSHLKTQNRMTVQTAGESLAKAYRKDRRMCPCKESY